MGDFEDILFVLSQTKAMVRAGIATPLTEEPSHKEADDSTEEDWTYFLEQWRRNGSCIRTCHCAKKWPTMYCNYLYRRNQRAEIDAAISGEERFLLLEMHDKAIAEANELLSKVHRYQNDRDGSRVYCMGIRARTLLLRGESFTSLGRHAEALADYMKVCEKAYPRTPQGLIQLRTTKYEAEAMYRAVATLGTLCRFREAFEMLAVLLKPTDAEKKGTVPVDEIVAAWRAKAVELMASLKEAMKNRAASQPPPTIVAHAPAAAAAAAAAASTSLAVDVPIGRCTYSSIGRVEDEADACIAETIIITRLQWVLLWVRGDILVWDYGKEEVVHWILVGEGGIEDTMATKFVDVPEHDSALYFRGSRMNGFHLIDLQRLSPRGGKTPIEEAAIFSKDGPGTFMHHVINPRNNLTLSPTLDDLEAWMLVTSLLLHDCLRINASQNSAGKWRLAVSHERQLVVDVYREDKIRSGTAMGPFFIGALSRPCFELRGNDTYAHLIEFVGPDSPFLVTAAGPVIRIWDALGSASTGECVHTIRDYQKTVRSICFSEAMMFSVAQREFNSDSDTDGCRVIDVWSMPKKADQGGFKKLASLKHEFLPEKEKIKSSSSSSPGKEEEGAVSGDNWIPPTRWTVAITTLKEESLLVTAHSDGVVNLWSYDDDSVEDAISNPCCDGDDNSPVVSHLRSFVFYNSLGSVSSVALFSEPGSLLYLGNLLNLFCLDLSCVSGGHGSDAVIEKDDGIIVPAIHNFASVRRSMGDCAVMMNCGHCGRYLVDKSSLCSGCKRTRFCDRNCQKSGWSAHKAACREAAVIKGE